MFWIAFLGGTKNSKKKIIWSFWLQRRKKHCTPLKHNVQKHSSINYSVILFTNIWLVFLLVGFNLQSKPDCAIQDTNFYITNNWILLLNRGTVILEMQLWFVTLVIFVETRFPLSSSYRFDTDLLDRLCTLTHINLPLCIIFVIFFLYILNSVT